MGENHIWILLCLLVHSIDITEGDTKNNVAALAYQSVHCGTHCIIILSHFVYNHQLSVGIQSQSFHCSGNSCMVCVGIPCGVALFVDINGTNFEIRILGSAGSCGACGTGCALTAICRGSATSTTGSQAKHHCHCHDKCQQFAFHFLCSS